MGDAAVFRFVKELRRRRVFRVAGLYVVSVWLLMQAADILFPAWGIPDAAIRYLLWAGFLGFPVALAFGWVFDITPEGIRRTRPVNSQEELQRSLPLQRSDYLILAAFLLATGAIVYDTAGRVMETATLEERRPSAAEIMPNSLAVLPFASLSSDPEHEYFAHGISEEILNRLSAFGELKVIARTSSFAFEDSGYDIGRISELLAVQYLLQGSVRRDGQQLRITAQLVDRTGVQVWSNTFDRRLGAVFAMQDEIADAVATSIAPQIVPRVPETRTPDLEAWQEYLVGREIMTRRDGLWWHHAPARFSRAIELDPDFAAAYASRAVGLIVGARWAEDYRAQFDLAQQDIDMALALDASSALAYAAQALVDHERNPTDAAAHEALLRRALSLDPNNVDILNWLATPVAAQGRHAEAAEILQRAARIDPLAPSVNGNLARAEARSGRIADAIRRLQRLLEVPQPSQITFLSLCALQSDAGRIAEALQCGKRRVMHMSPSEGRAIGTHVLILPYGQLGMLEQAEYWIARGLREWPEVYQGQLWPATILGHATGQISYEEALADFESVLRSAGVPAERLNRRDAQAYGILLALAGQHERSVPVLEAVLSLEDNLQQKETAQDAAWVDAGHALAWSYQQAGASEKAAALLQPLAQHFSDLQAEGLMHLGKDLVGFARNSVLLGDVRAGLELLERAEAAGWRDYYAALQDPRWDAARHEPRFTAVMARVKVDLDAQRAQVEAIEAEDDFVARLDLAIALQAGGEGVAAPAH